jgi:hypothetical protein
MSDEQRLFTVDEANALLGEVVPLVEALQRSQQTMEGLHEDVMSSIATNGGGASHRSFVDASREAERALLALTEMGVVVRDPSTGLIDFPSDRDGAVVFLCFRLGEARIEFWHDTESGFSGRQPL